MTALIAERNSDGSARLRLPGYPVMGYSIPTGGRFQVMVIDNSTGAQTLVTSVGNADRGLDHAATALLRRARGDGINVIGMSEVQW